MRRTILTTLFTLALGLSALPAFAQGRLTLYCSSDEAWCRLAKTEFEKKTGHKVVTVGGGSMGNSPSTIPNRLRAGQADDLIIIARPSVDDLVKAMGMTGISKSQVSRLGS